MTRDATPTGIAMSNRRPATGPWNPAGSTPTIVNGTRSTLSVASNDICLATEPPLPEAVADHRHRSCRTAAALIVSVGEVRPRIAGTPQRFKETAARPQAIDQLGFTARGQVEPRVVVAKHASEEMRRAGESAPTSGD